MDVRDYLHPAGQPLKTRSSSVDRREGGMPAATSVAECLELAQSGPYSRRQRSCCSLRCGRLPAVPFPWPMWPWAPQSASSLAECFPRLNRGRVPRPTDRVCIQKCGTGSSSQFIAATDCRKAEPIAARRNRRWAPRLSTLKPRNHRRALAGRASLHSTGAGTELQQDAEGYGLVPWASFGSHSGFLIRSMCLPR